MGRQSYGSPISRVWVMEPDGMAWTDLGSFRSTKPLWNRLQSVTLPGLKPVTTKSTHIRPPFWGGEWTPRITSKGLSIEAPGPGVLVYQKQAHAAPAAHASPKQNLDHPDLGPLRHTQKHTQTHCTYRHHGRGGYLDGKYIGLEVQGPTL